MSEHALSGTTVLDLSGSVDGPFCTKLLADFGARVIKVEPAEGDPARHTGPFVGARMDPECSAPFLYLNANKESITLDISTAAGQRACRVLAQRVDLVVENFAPGTLAPYGLAYKDLEVLNPALVYTSITPFGHSGPYAMWRGPDIVRQAVSGWMMQGGDPAREPLRSGGDLSLYITGVFAAAASLTGLHHARATGQGQHIDVSAMEAMITCTGQEVYRVGLDGDAAAFRRTGHRGLPFAVVPCLDGWVGINLLFPPHLVALCEWVGMTDILADDRYNTIGKLRANGRGGELNDRLSEWTMQHTMLGLVEAGQRRGLAVSPVPRMDQVMALPQHVARGYFQDMTHPIAGRYTQPGAPFRMSRTPWSARSPAPVLGEANEDVASWISEPDH
jgi:CoA:oxalate CoA-transferase